MFKKRFLLSSLFVAIFALSGSGVAATIVNGDFEAGLSGWNQAVNNGSVAAVAGTAVLSTGLGTALPAAVLVQGDDGFFSFGNPISLSAGEYLFEFDAVFTPLSFDDPADIAPLLSLLVDNLEVWMYDANDPSGASDIQIARIDASAGGGANFSFNLSLVSDRLVAFSFELNDEADGRNYQVALDNVRIVPLPGTLLLIMAGGFGYLGLGLRRSSV